MSFSSAVFIPEATGEDSNLEGEEEFSTAFPGLTMVSEEFSNAKAMTANHKTKDF